jgi:uncharacterized protein (TIGR02145 family)
MNNLQILMMAGGEPANNGYIYNKYTAAHADLMPTDWAVPTVAQYSTLISGLGGGSSAGGDLKESGLIHWDSPNTDADNSSGFSGFGSGYRLDNGTFLEILQSGYFMVNTTVDNGMLIEYDSAIAYQNQELDSGSIRAIYTGAGTPSTVLDYDGNVYDVILIGSQRWTVQNWKCTRLNTGTSIPNITANGAWTTATTTALGRCAYDNDENNV